MREIKFRGKRLENGEWVYGDLTRYSENMSYITVDLVGGEIYEVCTETVGQYTGLKDKNGNEIYEGDIIEDILTAEKEVIEFHGNMFALVSYKSRFFFTVFRSDEKQIIGNIYDNPELLEGER
jgi:uncharacterized phage protein (TIGR01671 family)